MVRGINKTQLTRNIVILAIAFLIGSILIHQLGDFTMYRALRGVICISFLLLIYFLDNRRINAVLAGFLLLYGTSSFLTVGYENNTLAILSMIANFLAFLVLIFGLIPKVSLKKMNGTLVILFAVLVGVNGYLLYEFVTMIKNFAESNLHYIFILLGAMSLVIAGFFSLLFNYIHSSKATLLFTLFVFSIIFGEVFRAMGYYDFAYGDIAVYVARALLIIGLSLLLNYVLISKKRTEILGKK